MLWLDEMTVTSSYSSDYPHEAQTTIAMAKNTPVPDAYQYFPLNEPQIGTPLQPDDENIPFLFQPLTIRGVTFKNRVFVSPMCQYSSNCGHATDWHLVHLGGFATRGVGAICIEATAITPEGRISPEDAGLWTDTQMDPLKRIVNFCHAQGTKIGIQLAHAGRKASTHAPWVQNKLPKGTPVIATVEDNGWPGNVVAPSEIPYHEQLYPHPKALTEQQILDLENAFIVAVDRCQKIGFDFIELHGAHGYLLHEFLSPLSNTRADEYGGQPLENRLRWFLRLVKRVRESWADKPLFVRLSATDWAEGPEKDDVGIWKQWGIEQSTILTGKLKDLGVDLIDTSSGGNWLQQKIKVGPSYQVPFAASMKRAHPDMLFGAVGLITDAAQAETILRTGQSDVIFLAREMLRNPNWTLTAAKQLRVKVKAANQYDRAWL